MIKNKNRLISFILSTLIFLSLLISIFFIKSSPLIEEEYIAIKGIYQEMRYVDNEIKSDFYTEILLKYLDRGFILTELKKDTLTYSLVVSNNMLIMLSNGETSKDVYDYIARSDLNFEKYVGLECSESLFKLYRNFISSNYVEAGEEGLINFGNSLYNIMDEEQNYLFDIRLQHIFIVCSIFISCGFWMYLTNILICRLERKRKD